MMIICVALVGCGAASKHRPTQVGAGYFQNTLSTGSCNGDCDEEGTDIRGGQGAQLEALFPRERVTPRLSVAVSRQTVDPAFAEPRKAVFVGGKLDWLFAIAGNPSGKGLAFNLGVGFGIDGMAQSYGADAHGVVEVEYRLTDWSFVGSATPEIMLLGGDGLSSDQTGLLGLPAFIGVRRAVE
jgi:hypothetical protein